MGELEDSLICTFIALTLCCVQDPSLHLDASNTTESQPVRTWVYYLPLISHLFIQLSHVQRHYYHK